jgi:hypothetical protein
LTMGDVVDRMEREQTYDPPTKQSYPIVFEAPRRS